MPYLWLIILVVFAAIALFSWYFSDAAKIRRTLKATPRIDIGRVEQGRVAKIAGAVRPLGQPLRAPLTGRACVFYEVTVEEYRSSGKSGRWVEIIKDVDSQDFLLEDGTGRALVKSAGMKVLPVKDRELSSGFMNDASPVLEDYLRQHGQSSQGWVFNKRLRYKEGVFEPGERVTVFGQCRWEQDPDPNAAGQGYRDTPKRLVVDMPDQGNLLASDEIDVG
ncbi:MAG: hypothetical protein U0441_09135 [Polyangiaceae bacterium]